jgi:D-amino peptidase
MSIQERTMRVYMMTDLEGVAGVIDSLNWCHAESPYYPQARDLLTGEVNAAIEGFLEAGATDILVADGHGPGAINPSLLHANAALARNWLPGRPYPFSLDERPFDVAAWIGQHPKAGTVGGHLCHTGNMGVRDASINGRSVGELGRVAMCAAELGVRAIFATGCEAFTREAQDLAPGIETVAVKRGVQTEPGHHLPKDAYARHNTAAVHLSPVEARRRIRDGAARALARARKEDFGRLPLAPPYEEVIVLRSDAVNPPRISRHSHPASVIELLNVSREFKPIAGLDPMKAIG